MKHKNKYEIFLYNIFLDAAQYLVGAELNVLLQEKFGISPDYSRKVIQRAVAKGIIHSSSPLTFGKGQYVYFGANTRLNKETVIKITKKYRPPVYRLLSIMDLNEGIISYYEALKVTASPLEESSTKVSTLEEIISVLKEVKLIDITIDQKGIKYLIDYSKGNENEHLMNMHFTKMCMDAVFLPDVLIWLRNHNLIDNENIRFRNKLKPSLGVKHNNLVWDAFAYTKTTGIHTVDGSKIKNINNKQTLVVLDMVVNRPYTDEDLQGFYSRIQIVVNSVKSGVRKVLPVIVSRDTSSLVSNKISKLGFLHLSLGTIFGEKIYEMIDKFNIIKIEQIRGIENSEQFVENIESILSTIRNTGQETNLGNIKGDLFEALLYPLLSNLYPNSSIYQGITLKSTDNEEKYEYDFIIISPNNDEIVIVEAKGYKSTAVIKLGNRDIKNTVMWFFRRTFPLAKKHYRSISEHPVKGCYITTASFEDTAITELDKLNEGVNKPKQLDLYYDGKKLIELVDTNGMKKMKSVLKKYYL